MNRTRSWFPTGAALALLLGWFLLPQPLPAQEGDKKDQAPDKVKSADPLPEVFGKKAPASVSDLKAIQDHLATVVEKVMPAVVCVRIGNSSGSGVVVSKDGYVLTAGHVSGQPGRDVTVIFHDGKKAKGKTLGGNHGIDSGLIQITTPGEWPFLEMGNSAELKEGQWCFVCAHPGGFKTGRTPPVRLGRLLRATASTLTTDCALVGGDSGGPLFDMQGRVIGINSRIGGSLAANMHVPVNPFKQDWERMVKAEVWRAGGNVGGKGKGKGNPTPDGPWLGVQTDTAAKNCQVKEVVAGSPAEKAGLKAGDVILKFDGKEVASATALAPLVRQKKVDDRVAIEVRRGEETLTLTVTIGKQK
jgi:serine protease Do